MPINDLPQLPGLVSWRIAFVTETYPPEVNGVAMTVGQLVDGLRQRGVSVRLFRPCQGAADRAELDCQLLPGLPLPGYPGLRCGLPAKRRLRRAWQSWRPDLVHVVTEGPLGWSAVSAARALGIPVTSGFHTNFDSYSVHYGLGWLRPMVAAYLRSLHRRTQRTLVPTASLAAELAGDGVPGVRVVGRGIDSQRFSPEHRDPALRQRYGVDEAALLCLYVGRLAPEKNLALVCRTFAAIQACQPNARMLWVGEGPDRASLAASHPDHHFAGLRTGDDLARHYASADLFIFPSLTETYGNVVAEAMASGLPVVAYCSAAAAELIRSQQNGVLAEPGDEAAFVAAALGLLDDAPGRKRQGAAARSTMLARGWAGVIERFLQVVAEVCQP